MPVTFSTYSTVVVYPEADEVNFKKIVLRNLPNLLLIIEHLVVLVCVNLWVNINIS